MPKTKEAELLTSRPEPCSKNVPEWYQKMPRYSGGEKNFYLGGITNKTAKVCMPFLDSFLTGYVQKTWSDLYIESDEHGNVRYSYSSDVPIIEHRDNPSFNFDGFYDMEFLWKMQWIPKLPKGYSMIYTHPFNRIDLPFYSTTGIVDSDKFFYEKEANHPFFIKKGFNGIIPVGTPMVMMIPFKRDSWTSSFKSYQEENSILGKITNNVFEGYYKKFFWTKKVFK